MTLTTTSGTAIDGSFIKMMAFHFIVSLHSLRPSDAYYIHQHNLPSLVQIMACRLFGDKPLSEPMLPFYQSDTREHISVKLHLKFRFLIKKMHLKMLTAKWRPFYIGLNVLKFQETESQSSLCYNLGNKVWNWVPYFCIISLYLDWQYQ